MNNLNIKFLIGMIIISVMSCTKEDPGGGGGETSSPITLECTHNADITLNNHNANGIDYIVDCDLTIRDGIFSISEGTSIQFRDGASLTVENDGILRAKGISGSPITMSGTNDGTPSWRGLYIYSSAGSNQLQHVTIQDAGDGEVFGQFTDNHAAVTFQGRLSMSNCTIENSGAIGIYSEENLAQSKIDLFENNTITGSKRYPILVNQDLIGDMDLSSCTFTENGDNFVGLHQESGDRLNNETTLEALDIPYFVETGINLYAGLTIESGVDLVMGNGSYIQSTSTENQYLLIQGSQSNHVTIRGQEAFSGYWQGIYITRPNALNIWEYLDISDGGSVAQGFNDTPANITLEQDGSLIINNCTSSRSGSSCDIVLHTFASIPTLENNSPDITSVCEE